MLTRSCILLLTMENKIKIAMVFSECVEILSMLHLHHIIIIIVCYTLKTCYIWHYLFPAVLLIYDNYCIEAHGPLSNMMIVNVVNYTFHVPNDLLYCCQFILYFLVLHSMFTAVNIVLWCIFVSIFGSLWSCFPRVNLSWPCNTCLWVGFELLPY